MGGGPVAFFLQPAIDSAARAMAVHASVRRMGKISKSNINAPTLFARAKQVKLQQ
jgi:hypothetical protein